MRRYEISNCLYSKVLIFCILSKDSRHSRTQTKIPFVLFLGQSRLLGTTQALSQLSLNSQNDYSTDIHLDILSDNNQRKKKSKVQY